MSLRVLLAQSSGSCEAVVSSFLAARACAITRVASIESVQRALESARFEAIFLDLALSLDDCLRLLESIATQPAMPALFVIASSEPAQVGFRLAQLGVRAVLREPIDAHTLARVWCDVLGKPPDLRPLVRSSVGLIGMRKIEGQVRAEMIAEALARSQGSRRGAAAMLEISRQLLQHIVRNGDDP